jgi:hypothetical protein
MFLAMTAFVFSRAQRELNIREEITAPETKLRRKAAIRTSMRVKPLLWGQPLGEALLRGSDSRDIILAFLL